MIIRSSMDIVHGWTIMRSSMDVVHGWTIMKSSMDDDQKSVDDSTVHTMDGRTCNT